VSVARLVALDTPIWIAFIEQKSAFLAEVNPLFESLKSGRVRVVTSSVGLIEILTGALLRGDELLARRTEEVLTGLDGSTVVPVTLEVARHAARLRAAYGLRTPDAIHLATAVATGAVEFVTTDRRLARVREIEIRVLKAASRVSKR
jgi:predicted nucleic acid-binding protein